MTRICENCKKEISFWHRFKFNPDTKNYLNCSNCGADLINGHKLILHYFITGLIFVLLLNVDDELFGVVSIVYDFLLVVGVPLVYFYVFLPIRNGSKKH